MLNSISKIKTASRKIALPLLTASLVGLTNCTKSSINQALQNPTPRLDSTEKKETISQKEVEKLQMELRSFAAQYEKFCRLSQIGSDYPKKTFNPLVSQNGYGFVDERKSLEELISTLSPENFTRASFVHILYGILAPLYNDFFRDLEDNPSQYTIYEDLREDSSLNKKLYFLEHAFEKTYSDEIEHIQKPYFPKFLRDLYQPNKKSTIFNPQGKDVRDFHFFINGDIISRSVLDYVAPQRMPEIQRQQEQGASTPLDTTLSPQTIESMSQLRSLKKTLLKKIETLDKKDFQEKDKLVEELLKSVNKVRTEKEVLTLMTLCDALLSTDAKKTREEVQNIQNAVYTFMGIAGITALNPIAGITTASLLTLTGCGDVTLNLTHTSPQKILTTSNQAQNNDAIILMNEVNRLRAEEAETKHRTAQENAQKELREFSESITSKFDVATVIVEGNAYTLTEDKTIFHFVGKEDFIPQGKTRVVLIAKKGQLDKLIANGGTILSKNTKSLIIGDTTAVNIHSNVHPLTEVSKDMNITISTTTPSYSKTEGKISHEMLNTILKKKKN